MDIQSPIFFPIIANNMNCSDAWVDNNIKHVLRMVSLLVAFAIVHAFNFEESTLYKYLISFQSFPDRNQGFVHFFGPFKIRFNLIFILVERSSDDQQLEQLQKKLFSLGFGEYTI